MFEHWFMNQDFISAVSVVCMIGVGITIVGCVIAKLIIWGLDEIRYYYENQILKRLNFYRIIGLHETHDIYCASFARHG